MRDGIYKSLPLGRGWKSLLRSCEREKERGETACVKARRAIIAELCIEVLPAFIHEIRARARQNESISHAATLEGTIRLLKMMSSQVRRERKPKEREESQL
jgi:hypothetical protein